MSKTHFASFVTPQSDWIEARDVKCLCGYQMLDALRVLDFQMPVNHDRTLLFCSGCVTMAMLKQDEKKRTWTYGVLPKQEAIKVNRGEE